MNKTDWSAFLSMQLDLGAANLDIAAANISGRLPMTSGGLRPSVVLSVPYPDPRSTDWGSLTPGSGPGKKSLNFTRAADRLAAVSWWLDQAVAQFKSRNFSHVHLDGFYWFFEEIASWAPDNTDDVLVPAVSRHIKAIDADLLFEWIPYYRPGDPHTARWRALGFDFATLQPNYAFNNV
jgi:hypothetical protein